MLWTALNTILQNPYLSHSSESCHFKIEKGVWPRSDNNWQTWANIKEELTQLNSTFKLSNVDSRMKQLIESLGRTGFCMSKMQSNWWKRTSAPPPPNTLDKVMQCITTQLSDEYDETKWYGLWRWWQWWVTGHPIIINMLFYAYLSRHCQQLL
jgi:hypothetical protein